MLWCTEVFDAKVWGQCKVEVYTKKGYIRKVLGGGKFGSIINCDKGDFGKVLHVLVDYVKKGSSKAELTALRDELVNKYNWNFWVRFNTSTDVL